MVMERMEKFPDTPEIIIPTPNAPSPNAHRQSELSALAVKPMLVAYAMCHMRAAGYHGAFTFSGPFINPQADSMACV